MGTPLVPILLAIVGTMLLAIALVFHLRMKQLKMKSEVARRSWHAVPAKILYSRAEESRSEDGDRPVTMFCAWFRYE